MRITNKIMQRNNLANINTNKLMEDTLTTQMSTQKKINRPSDDPVVAIRALRLRSNVTEVTQYYSKNAPDANSWLKITEDALTGTSQIITNMIAQFTKGSNGDLTSQDRQIILEQIQALSKEVYATGDADYAGRYVFTGLRTDTSLSFQNKDTTKYSITEQLSNLDIDQVTHVNTDALGTWTAANYNGIATTEQEVNKADVYRIRLSYKNMDNVAPRIEIVDKVTPEVKDGKYVNDKGEEVNTPEEAKQNVAYKTIPADPTAVQVAKATGKIDGTDDDPYTYVSKNDDAVVFLQDTGELLLGKNAYNELMAVKDEVTTSSVNEGEIRVTYVKSDWLSSDLRPQHYFRCTDKTNNIEYNEDYLDPTKEKQVIEYDVGFNQTIRINSTADESYNLGIARTVDDVVSAINTVTDLEALIGRMKEKLDSLGESETEAKNTIKTQMNAAEKSLTYAKDILQKSFESGITAMQGYLDDTSLAITAVGTRSSKLELITSRLQNQKTSFETLKSENEDVDITEVAINLSSANVTYEASLQATGKIMQNTLLNYI